MYRDGSLISEYTYDLNGNRLSKWTPSETLYGDYDAQDRLLRYGRYEYEYRPSGELYMKRDTLTGGTK